MMILVWSAQLSGGLDSAECLLEEERSGRWCAGVRRLGFLGWPLNVVLGVGAWGQFCRLVWEVEWS